MTSSRFEFVGLLTPPRLALKLARLLRVEEARAKHRGRDAEVDDHLSVWLRIATTYATADRGNAVVPLAATGGSSKPEGMTTAQIADATGIPERTIRAAINRGDMAGEKFGGAWFVLSDEVTAWRKSRPGK